MVALSTMEKSATRLPIAAGLNATRTVHEAGAASEARHVFAVMEKSFGSVPAKPKLVKETVPEPPAVRVKFCAAEVTPIFCVPKDKDDGLMVMVALFAAVPAPLRVAAWGLLPAVSTKVMVAVRVPVAVGWKITPMEQDALGSRAEVRQPLVLMLKSPALVPEIVTELTAIADEAPL